DTILDEELPVSQCQRPLSLRLPLRGGGLLLSLIPLLLVQLDHLGPPRVSTLVRPVDEVADPASNDRDERQGEGVDIQRDHAARLLTSLHLFQPPGGPGQGSHPLPRALLSPPEEPGVSVHCLLQRERGLLEPHTVRLHADRLLQQLDGLRTLAVRAGVLPGRLARHDAVPEGLRLVRLPTDLAVL